MEQNKLALLVPRRLVKDVKTLLEEQKLLSRAIKIKAEDMVSPKTEESQGTTSSEPRMVIYTNIPSEQNQLRRKNEETNAELKTLLAKLGLENLKDNIGVSSYATTTTDAKPPNGPYLNALRAGLESLTEGLLSSLELSIDTLISTFPDSYTTYKPMLLLPHNAFASPPWKKLLSSHPPTSQTLQPIWQNLAAATTTTHIAINAGIPPSTRTSTPPKPALHSEPPAQENILRSPVNLMPLYGDFGHPPTPQSLSHPTANDFASAFWVSQTQNGIYQTWAPLYTMFSRGNIREKTRVLTLPSVLNSAKEEKGCTAVDFYAGIGYFAFSYKKAGVKKVLCWELNPWSIEGLRRGAERNGWTTQIFTDLPETKEDLVLWAKDVKDVDFLVFKESNEYALRAIAALDPEAFGWPAISSVSLPPIRHVNCGFLPSSKFSWDTAVRALDCELGGWIHAHENVGVRDVEERKGEVVAEMQGCLDRWEGERGYSGFVRRRARCEHVERVKTYAPGVLHVVFDVWVDGMRDAEEV